MCASSLSISLFKLIKREMEKLNIRKKPGENGQHQIEKFMCFSFIHICKCISLFKKMKIIILN